MKVEKNYLTKRKEQHLHSPAHVLADELATRLSDKKHFGLYLRMASLYSHDVLRRIAGEVLEGKAKNPGALFAYLVKKNKDNQPNA